MPKKKEDREWKQGDEAPEEDGTPSASLNPPAEITVEEINTLQEKARERDDFLDKLQRTRADYINFQKRVQREMDAHGELVLQRLMNDLTPVIDHLDRAAAAAEEGSGVESLLEGVELIRSQLYQALAQHGIERIETVGRPFDPAYHEAVMQEETEEFPDAMIIEELRQGFMLNGRTIVPAKVKVAKRPEVPDEDRQYGDEDEEEAEDSEGDANHADI